MAWAPVESNVLINGNATGLAISSTNLYKPIFDARVQTIEDLKFLLLTHVGELVMQPEFGTRLLFVLFESNSSSSDLKETIDDIIKTAVARWMPSIDIEKIDITTSEDDTSLSHDIVIKLTVAFPNLKNNVVVEIAANNSGTIIVSSNIGTENGK